MDKEILDGLKRGLTNEIAGEEFYTKTADEAKDDFTKNTFLHLAKDEIYHIKRIKEFLDIDKTGEIEEEIRNRNPKSALSFFGLTEKEFKEKKESFKGDFAPYDFAIELETRAMNLYKKLLKEAEDEKTKALFKFLVKEETTHKKLLEEAKEFLNNPEDYFLEQEGWHFD